MTTFRLPNRGRVDHGKPVRFSFDGSAGREMCASPA